MERKQSFIPGIWEEEINVTDFINLNVKKWDGTPVLETDKMDFPENYDMLSDKENRFFYLKPLSDSTFHVSENKEETLFLDEKKYATYVRTAEIKKFLEMGLIVEIKKEKRWCFLHPDFCTVPLYGTRKLIRNLKNYLKDLDNQFQTDEWKHRKINISREIEALLNFEEFALENGINTKKPAKNAVEAIQLIWLAIWYAFMENPKVPFTFYSIIPFLDIYLERDIRKGEIGEKEAQRMVDELYLKIFALRSWNEHAEEFDYSFSFPSRQITKTSLRFFYSALKYNRHQIPVQLIFNENPFPKKMVEITERLYETGFPLALSRSLRKRNAVHLTLTSYHTFFRNYFDIAFLFGSFDLKKGLLIALNGGKDVETNSNLQQVTKRIEKKELELDEVMEQFEAFLRYYTTIYTEYINAYAYYYDLFHNMPFRQSLTFYYPYYLINIPFHHMAEVTNILSAVSRKQFEVMYDDRGYIKEIVPLTTEKEKRIAVWLNDLLHKEVKRMLFYKNGHYNILLFMEKPFYHEQDKEGLLELPLDSYTKSSVVGYQDIGDTNLEKFIETFLDSSYTHIRLERK